jgi:ribosomal protein L30/L7E
MIKGLPKAIRTIVTGLGLNQRHQVIWRPVSPKTAGQIIKIKELVHVELVNEIPKKQTRPTGFVKIGNAIGASAFKN